MQEEYGLDSADTVLQKTPFSFDVSVWEFFWPIMAGARLVLAEPGGHRDSGYLARLIEEASVTVMHFVPSMLRAFLEESRLRDRCASLRDVMCSGEALSYDLQQRFFEQIGARLHNLYGPTEAAVDVTYWQCDRDAEERVVPIGHPVANTQIYVVNEALEPVPTGSPGELLIGGIQVGRGYWNRPELTSERFLADPFSDVPGARLYRTGDLARRREDGSFEFLGRIDHQVKIRGNRIELGEIEAILCEHPAIRQAVVVPRGDDASEVQLVAYVAGPARGMPAPTDLRQHLSKRLPEYMVPAVYVVLEAIPLSPNGKVDRKALPEPPAQAGTGARTDLEPLRTETEQLVAGIWREVLGRPDIGGEDNFFDLGGHSLMALRVLNRLNAQLGTSHRLRLLFEHTTLRALAAALTPLEEEEAIEREEVRF
jgi:acyl-coenzyme A synthetase/AMP-(fatty) acid ligase